MLRKLVVAAIMTAVALSASSAQAGAKKYATPQAVFDAIKAAAKKKDYKAVTECFTDDTVDAMTGAMIFVGSMIKGFAKFDKSDKSADTVKELDKLFDKYGITEESLKSVPKGGLKDPEAMNKALRAAGKTVKKRNEFLADMTKLMEAAGKQKDNLFDANATLKDVTIDGDSAKGTVVGAKGEKPITFKKIDGGWKIELPIDFGGKKKAGAGGSSYNALPQRRSEAVMTVRANVEVARISRRS